MPSPKKRAPRKGAASKRPPTLSEDFVALLGEFENARVEYVIVGGYAVGIHGRPRATKDLDRGRREPRTCGGGPDRVWDA